MEQWASTGQHMDCLSRPNSSLIGPKNPAKFENDRITRNGHRFKITQSTLMIVVKLVSFSSAEDALFNEFTDVKNMTFLARKVLEIRRSAFFWGGTPGIARFRCPSLPLIHSPVYI